MFKRLLYFLFGFTTCGFTLMFLDRIGILNPRILNSRINSVYTRPTSYVPYRRPYVSYSDYYRERNDYKNYEFYTRKDAEDAIDSLQDLISDYGYCTEGDVYDLIGMPVPAYGAERYGWTNLDGISVHVCKNGKYKISYPLTKFLNEEDKS